MAVGYPPAMNNSESDFQVRKDVYNQAWFASTHWSVVLLAGKEDSPQAGKALETLCRTYWPPVYRFLRGRGFNQVDAEDLTQDYFFHLLRKNLPGRADPEKGKFRSFLLHTLKQFVADQQSKARAKKRGGHVLFVSLEAQEEEQRGCAEFESGTTPELAFERRWVTILLERVTSRLHQEYAANGRQHWFDQLQGFQPGEQPNCTYEEAAQNLGMSLPAIKSAIHRLRRRHAEILREEIAQTVSSPAEIDTEIRYFVSCWSR